MVASGYKSLMSRPVRAVCGTCHAKNRFKAALNPTLLMIVSYIATSTLDARRHRQATNMGSELADGIIQTNAKSFESPTEGKRIFSPITP